jgi:PIN domain nuclease of toxin-antitoxin system
MKLLLDTQVFLWFISADRRMPDAWKELIRQALQHDLVIMTANDLIRAYPVRVVAARAP